MALCAAIAGAVSTVQAANVNVCLHLNSGEKAYFYFEDHPVMTFDGSDMHMTYKGNQLSVHGFSAVHKITFEDKSGIDAAKTTDGTITSNAGVVTLSGFKPGTAVNVADVNGRLLLSDAIATDEHYSLSLDSYAKGVYIVTVGNISYKVTNR